MMTARTVRRRRVIALLAGAMVPLVLLAGMLLPVSIQQTEAGWTAETSVSATAAAAVIPAPQLTAQCQYRPGVLGLGAEVRIHWALPAGYELTDIVFQKSSNGLGSLLEPITGFSGVSGTTRNTDGTYTTTVPVGLLGGLLGLGSGMNLGVTVKDDSGWTSQPALVMARSGAIAGLGSGCWNQT